MSDRSGAETRAKKCPGARASRGASEDYTDYIRGQALTVNEFGGAPKPPFPGIEDALSNERFGAYMASAKGDRDKALALYRFNSQASAALYIPLQVLEVTLRNRFHHHLSEAYGECWFDRHGVITHAFQRHKISESQLELAREKRPLEPGRIIAGLTFGFWTTCLSGPYDESLWRKGGLSKAFTASGEKPKRGKVNALLNPIRRLRNRIAHHEPILYWDLPKHYANMLLLTRWLVPVAADWCEAHSNFPAAFDPDFAKEMLKPAQRPTVSDLV